MHMPRVGLDLTEKQQSVRALAAIQRAEERGLPMLWSTTGAAAPDTMTLFAAAATQTRQIGLGTAIVPTYPRHPVVLATQTLVIDQLAPGRFRLGIGPSHRPTMERRYGLPMGKPLDHLREYLTVLRALLWEGEVDFDGACYSVHHKVPGTAQVPIYISALRENAYRLAGELADGAISWLCPIQYLRHQAIPAMRDAAAQAGREAPRMVAHVPVVMTTDQATMRSVARQRVQGYTRLPFYARMFAAAGYPVGAGGEASDDLLNHLIVWGSQEEIRGRLADILDGGIDEILAMLIPAGDLPDEEAQLSEVLAELGA